MLVALESEQYTFRAGSAAVLALGGASASQGVLSDGVISGLQFSMAGDYLISVQPCIVEHREEHFTAQLMSFAVKCAVTEADIKRESVTVMVGWSALVRIEWTDNRDQQVTIGVSGESVTLETSLGATSPAQLLLTPGPYFAYLVSSSARFGVPFDVTREKGIRQVVLLTGNRGPGASPQNLTCGA
jgi:hypothetical protein